ncbi:hypothetical protein OG830_39445 [Streptomyces sp. NBC_00121]|uniref:hypothetical protein n=1 Tax=unclassified Streptomyces TaxID=2593676 RepID=UPI002DDA16BC|nr:hypothetical protein [Streptomyces sp. NBC_01760]WSC74151.1 hypothetical protein OG807_40120 [Streptomyces sp. NBC_01760]
MRRVVDEAFEALGTLDVVVNDAGYGLRASVEEASDEQIRRVIEAGDSRDDVTHFDRGVHTQGRHRLRTPQATYAARVRVPSSLPHVGLTPRTLAKSF